MGSVLIWAFSLSYRGRPEWQKWKLLKMVVSSLHGYTRVPTGMLVTNKVGKIVPILCRPYYIELKIEFFCHLSVASPLRHPAFDLCKITNTLLSLSITLCEHFGPVSCKTTQLNGWTPPDLNLLWATQFRPPIYSLGWKEELYPTLFPYCRGWLTIVITSNMRSYVM